MSLQVWTVQSGYVLTEITNEETVTIPLPVTNANEVTFSVISGELPPGLRLNGNNIVGTPYSVVNQTLYEFCIRASLDGQISDRTLVIQNNSNVPPQWITPVGNLPIGPNKQLYVLDQSYIEYQLEAVDFSLNAPLTYFISSGDCHLPLGLTLSRSGLISGYILPQFAITKDDSTQGNYDTGYFDNIAYDYGKVPTDGYDSYSYDDVFYDYTQASNAIKSINANYQFKVTATDGNLSSQRVFNIFVIGDGQFHADSLDFIGNTASFSADASFVRSPMWITSSNLGFFRSNNYVTLPVALYNNTSVLFRLEYTNHEVTAVSKASYINDNTAGQSTISFTSADTPVIGQYVNFSNYVLGATDQTYYIQTVTNISANTWRATVLPALDTSITDNIPFYIGSLSQLPIGMQFDVETGTAYGNIPNQPEVARSYTFTITATKIATPTEQVSSSRTFNMTVLGSVYSSISWKTESNLGTIAVNLPSTLSVVAESTQPNAEIVYTLIGGNIPHGMSLALDGELIGSPKLTGDSIVYKGVYINQPANVGDVFLIDGIMNICTSTLPTFEPYTITNFGMTIFDGGTTTFDGGTTTFDHLYTFDVYATDQYGFNPTTRTFSLIVSTESLSDYCNFYVKPLLAQDSRNEWQQFIDNPSIFTPANIYRPSDPTFGVQSSLEMIVYAGLEKVSAAQIVSAMSLNHKKKHFSVYSVENAVARDPVTKLPVYEVVYLRMVDPLSPNGENVLHSLTEQFIKSEEITVDSSTIYWSNTLADMQINAPELNMPSRIITVDSAGYFVSDSSPTTYFPNSITAWQQNLSELAPTERNFLPLWMRSIPSGAKQELGYVTAVPLCYCKVGTSQSILLNIKYSGFDFTKINYEVDRYLIRYTDLTPDRFILFRNDRITI